MKLIVIIRCDGCHQVIYQESWDTAFPEAPGHPSLLYLAKEHRPRCSFYHRLVGLLEHTQTF